MNTSAARIVEEFSKLDDWLERYRYLVALGEAMPRLPEEERTEDDGIPGCQYNVWIRVEHDRERDVLRLRADSDARITRGLAALILRVLDGQPPEAVAEADFGFLNAMGLDAHLSAQRSNGLAGMIHHIRVKAEGHRNGSEGAR